MSIWRGQDKSFCSLVGARDSPSQDQALGMGMGPCVLNRLQGASQNGGGQRLGRNPATPLPLLLPLSGLGLVQLQSMLGSRPRQLSRREKK